MNRNQLTTRNSMAQAKRVHIIGRKNSGKTTLIVELVEYYVARGIRVGTIKHTHHQHELDTPGKDSHRHRVAGAAVVGILSPQLNAVFFDPEHKHDSPDQYARLVPLFADCELILVEGHLDVAAPRIEVWRAAAERQPLAVADTTIHAVVTDDPLEIDVPVLARTDIGTLADFVRRVARG